MRKVWHRRVDHFLAFMPADFYHCVCVWRPQPFIL